MSESVNEEIPLHKRKIVYFVPKMEQVTVKRNIAYKNYKNSDLSMDIYYPPNSRTIANYPVVIFVLGYSDSVMTKNNGLRLKDMQAYISWPKLCASFGIIGITYETEEPALDVLDLMTFLKDKAETLKIDKNKIGIWSCSANVPTALYVLIKEGPQFIKCAVFYYGLMFDLNNSSDVFQITGKYGAVYPIKGNTVNDLPGDIPLLIIRAGLETVPHLNNSIDHFISQAILNNFPLSFHNYSKGRHAFDILDDNEVSREFIKQTIKFFKRYLLIDS